MLFSTATCLSFQSNQYTLPSSKSNKTLLITLAVGSVAVVFFGTIGTLGILQTHGLLSHSFTWISSMGSASHIAMLTFSGIGFTLIIIGSIKLYRPTNASSNPLPTPFPFVSPEPTAPVTSHPAPTSYPSEQGSFASSNTPPARKRRTWKERRQEPVNLAPLFSTDHLANHERRHWDKKPAHVTPSAFKSRLPIPSAHFNSFLIPHASPDSLKSDQSPCSGTRRSLSPRHISRIQYQHPSRIPIPKASTQSTS